MKDTHRLKVEGWKKTLPTNKNVLKAGVAIPISDNIDTKTKGIVRDKEGQYIMIKGAIQNYVTLVNIYVPNIEAPKYAKQILKDSNTVTTGDFNKPLTSMEISSSQKINKEMEGLNDRLDQIILIDIYRAFHPQAAEHTFFSSTHGTFSRLDHTLRYKTTSLNKLTETKIISSIFFWP